jgi:hypothetical protein
MFKEEYSWWRVQYKDTKAGAKIEERKTQEVGVQKVKDYW